MLGRGVLHISQAERNAGSSLKKVHTRQLHGCLCWMEPRKAGEEEGKNGVGVVEVARKEEGGEHGRGKRRRGQGQVRAT